MVVGSPIVLNLIPGGVMPVIMINETDKGYQKEFLIYNGNEPYNVPANVSATIRGTKRDGLGVTEAATVTAGSNVVRITVTEQMTAVPGKNIFELVFVNTNGLRVATINFIMLVERSALNADTVISESDIAYSEQVLNQLGRVAAFKEQLDNASDDVADLKTHTSWYVMPEDFGAVGDGVTDDTQAIQDAIDSGLAVIGKGVYLVGGNVTPSGTVRNVFTITRPLTMRCRFIDNRQPTASFNLRQYAVFRIESDNVNLDIEVTGNNNLPVDSADGVNLSDIAGYAVDFTNTEEVSNCKINLTCKNVNGIGHGKCVKDSVFNIFAEHCAYPWAVNYAVGCTVNIVSEDQHRTFYGAIDGSEVNAKCKNFVSTGSSGHFLLTESVVDGVTHLCENTTINIEDTGTTVSNAYADYFIVNLQYANHTAYINAEVWIKGDAGDLDTAAFNVTNVGTIKGNLTIHNAYKNAADSRMYNSIDCFRYIEDSNANGDVTYQAKSTNGNQRIFVEGATNFIVAGAFDGLCFVNNSKKLTIAGSAVINGTIYASDVETVNNYAQTQNIYISPFEKSPLFSSDLKTLIQKPGDTVTLYGNAVGNIYPDKTLLVAIPLPFVAKNQNYSVVVNIFGVNGIVSESAEVAETVTVSSKRTTAFVLSYVGTNTNMTYGRAFMVGYRVTITFA